MITTQEKIKMLQERIINMQFHIDGLLTEKDTSFFQNELYEEFYAKITKLKQELEALTNQG